MRLGLRVTHQVYTCGCPPSVRAPSMNDFLPGQVRRWSTWRLVRGTSSPSRGVRVLCSLCGPSVVGLSDVGDDGRFGRGRWTPEERRHYPGGAGRRRAVPVYYGTGRDPWGFAHTPLSLLLIAEEKGKPINAVTGPDRVRRRRSADETGIFCLPSSATTRL